MAFLSLYDAPCRRLSIGDAGGVSTETLAGESLVILRNSVPAQSDGALQRSLLRKSGSAISVLCPVLATHDLAVAD
jgi:hypothetical protein